MQIVLKDGMQVGRHDEHLMDVLADRDRIAIAIRTGLENDGLEACGCGIYYDVNDYDKCPRCGEGCN